MTDDADIRDVLREVEDPVFEEDIVSLDLVENIAVEEEQVEITVAFNAPFSDDEMAMGDEIRAVVERAGFDPSVTVPTAWRAHDSPLEDVRNVVPVASGKGGVGKTTIATNLAAALSETGAQVGLLDADIYGPNVPGMMGVEAEPGMSADGDIVPPEVDGMKLMSMAFLSEDDTDPALLRGPMVDKLLTELLQEVDWGYLDYLIVDLPPGTGDEQLTLVQNVPVTGAVVVTTPEDIALEDVRKGIRMFSDRGTPVLGVVENMSTFQCPDCGGEHELYGSGGGERLAQEFEIPLLARIPMDPAIRAGSNTAQPIAMFQEARAADRFRELGDAVADEVGAINRAEAAGYNPSDSETPRAGSREGNAMDSS